MYGPDRDCILRISPKSALLSQGHHHRRSIVSSQCKCFTFTTFEPDVIVEITRQPVQTGGVDGGSRLQSNS
ncbi:hypothetical protein WJX77_012102 [Trebouxia sp. C0004]